MRWPSGKRARDIDDERTFLGRASLVVTSEEVAASQDDAVPWSTSIERTSGTRVFRYVVRMVETPAPSYGAGLTEADDVTVRLEVRPAGGGQGYDIMDWSADQIAHDVLDHYERWLEFLTSTETGATPTSEA